jgi:hypothetical protein
VGKEGGEKLFCNYSFFEKRHFFFDSRPAVEAIDELFLSV